MVQVQDRLKATARPGASWGDLYEDCYALACESYNFV